MEDIIVRIGALLVNTPPSEIEEFEVTRCLRDCRDEIIDARACAEMMLQGTGQRLAESMAKRVIDGQAVGAWIPVDERLPKDGEDALIVMPPDEDGEREVEMAEWHAEAKVWTKLSGILMTVPGYLVTHWMPLPEPP
jgi:hypothetical protein